LWITFTANSPILAQREHSGSVIGPTFALIALPVIGSWHVAHSTRLPLPVALAPGDRTALTTSGAGRGADAEADGGVRGGSSIAVHSTSITALLGEPPGERGEEPAAVLV
jgi:hypothetical protein